MLVICYKETSPNNGLNKYDTTHGSITQWKEQHPMAIVEYVFDHLDDTLYQERHQQDLFNHWCGIYDFKPEDYNKPLYDNKGHLCRFVGFIPKNRKYNCRIYDTETDCYYKVSPLYVRTRLQTPSVSEE